MYFDIIIAGFGGQAGQSGPIASTSLATPTTVPDPDSMSAMGPRSLVELERSSHVFSPARMRSM